MWSPAELRRRLSGQLACCVLLALMSLCAGCHARHGVTQTVLSRRCVAGTGQPADLVVVAPMKGTLRFTVEQRGISLVASTDGDARTAAESPIARLGSIVLIVPARAGEHHTLQIHLQESSAAASEYCAHVDLIGPADQPRYRAALLLANAARATHSHDWSVAFEAYLAAGRQLDEFHAKRAAGAARYALAELAYLRLDRKRDSYALASEAFTRLADASPAVRGALLSLQAKALLESPGSDVHLVAARVRALQAQASKQLALDAAGARELPRLDIMAGFLEYRLDAPAAAQQIFISAAQRCRELQDWECYAIANQNLAALAIENRNYTIALSSFARLLDELPAGIDSKLTADIWNNYGTLQALAGLYSDSERSHATAMRGYAEIGDCPGVRRTLVRSGSLLVQLGSLSDAMGSLHQAATLDCPALFQIARSLPARNPAGGVSAELMQTIRAPQPTEAERCGGTLDPARLATDNRVTVLNALIALAGALDLQGQPGAAQRCLEAADGYAATSRARMRLAAARGEVFLEEQNASAARAEFQQALRIADAARLPAAHESRGAAEIGLVRTALLLGDGPDAVRRGGRALRSSAARGDVENTVTSLRLLASGYRAMDKDAEAMHTLEAAANLIETVPIDELDAEQRATYLATQHSVFAQLTDLYVSAASLNVTTAAAAFSTSERGRSRSLRYAITQAVRNAEPRPQPPEASRYQAILQAVTRAPGNQSGPEALIMAINAAVHREPAASEDPDPQRLTATLAGLHSTLIEYAVGTQDMFGFVLDRTGLHVVRLGERRAIARAASELQERLLDPEAPASEVRVSAGRLAALVLWPLQPLLSGERLIVVPDGSLHTVPFNVLPWSAADQTPVLQHAEVAISPSAAFLTEQLQVRHVRGHGSAPRFALLGDPVFRLSDWQRQCREELTTPLREAGPGRSGRPRSASDWTEMLPRLPASRTEVQMVAQLAQQTRPGSHIEQLLGCAAVPTALRRAVEERVDLLHIATHARVDSQRPRLSALALTPEPRGTGTASAFGLFDILGMKLDSSLVVLSACETSRGRLLPGEGVLGPAQAFLQAGAAAVVASYWRVDDETTARFMQQFYTYLLTERLPAATALRRAQLDQARSSTAHDWAAFAIYGWPDSGV